MLVAAFGVEIGGPVQLRLDIEHGVPGRAGLEPDVEDVHLLAEGGVAAGAGGAGGENRDGFVDVPGVGAFALEEGDERGVDGGVAERLVAFFAEEDGDGHAPDALAGDAPVRAGGDHVGDALLAPGGIPLDLLDFVERALAEGGAGERGLHFDEPLFGGAHNDGLVAAPAVRIGMLNAGRPEQCAVRPQHIHDYRVRLEDRQPLVRLIAGVHLAARIIHVKLHVDAVALAGDEVIHAMRRRGVHSAGALLRRHIIRVHSEDAAVEKGMLEGHAIQHRSLEASNLQRRR